VSLTRNYPHDLGRVMRAPPPAIGGATGAVALAVMEPTDLGWVGGSSVAAALAVLLVRGRQERLKPVKIAG
jgi:hypothetical protein